jgi:hypothetical protein
MDIQNPRLPEEEFVNGLPKNNPFTLPYSYFEELPQSILIRVKGSETPQLSQKIDSAFEVPQGYFEHFPSQIVSKSTSLKTRGKIIRLIHINRIFVAAVALLAIGLVLLLSKAAIHNSEAIAHEPATDDEILTYLENNDVSIDLVTEVYTALPPRKNNSVSSIPDSNMLIEEYIFDNADEQLILEEL